MRSRIESLAAIESHCWRELVACVGDSTHPWRTPVLATVDGERADARIVILREADAQARSLVFFTDSRSPKLQQLRAHPAATLVLWSPEHGWQLRIEATLTAYTDGLETSSRWARLKLSPAARDYLSPLPPGTPLDRFVPDRASREHFAVVSARVEAIDWLELDADGHRRARFDAAGARWLQP
ncbi:MAG TPA: pyridoxamine 5'-phosphate oxidase family protein [Burkholderiaceae bacterium]|nr:pyridoxamine 5'-phosphate oxidase family protein [Burkholderiaceae bacterium]